MTEQPALPAGQPEPIDGEIVTDAEYTRIQRMRDRWRVVRADPQTRRQVGRELVGRTLRSPVTVTTAVGRGAAVSARAWREWERVADYYDAAKTQEKLADKWPDIHHHHVARRTISGVVAVPSLTAVCTAPFFLDAMEMGVLGATTAAVLAWVGRRKDGAPGRKSIFPAGRGALAWAMDGDNLVTAFRDAKAIGRDENLQFAIRPHRDGDGWAVTVDLPSTRKASEAIRAREALASALGVDEVQLILERVRGKGGHAGRLDMWVADEDPYDRAPTRSPLEDADSFDLWRPVPFGTTARGRRVYLPLLWSNILIGALPRAGKTVSARIPATAAALDPHARIYVADGKGGKDWSPLQLVAHRFMRGDDDDTVARLVEVLTELVGDVKRRYAAMADMDDDECPESKVTRALTQSPQRNMPLTVLFVDELQVYTEHEIHGERIVDLLVYLVKKAPAAGVIVVLSTQKPDAEAVPPRLRDVIGTRFALRVKTWQSSEAILGTGTSKAGINATTFLPAHRGVGFLLGADGETELEAGEVVIARTDMLEIAAVRAACLRGRDLRHDTQTLTGDALEWEPGSGPVHATAERTDRAPQQRPMSVPDPGPLAMLAAYLEDEDRDRVPTRELVEEALDEEPTQRAVTALGSQLKEWGAPAKPFRTADGTQVRGPAVSDVLAAARRAQIRPVTDARREPVAGSSQAEPVTGVVTRAVSSEDVAL
jgi:S-DNA-T family DNA segregation ATPase FtsK/SpoIIIE